MSINVDCLVLGFARHLQHILIEHISLPFLSFGPQHQDLVRMLGIDAGTAIRHSIMKK